MQAESLLSQGLELMLIGMGTVFVFLTLLVFATRAMSAVALRLQPAAVADPRQPSTQAKNPDEEIVAAIAGAITQHQARK